MPQKCPASSSKVLSAGLFHGPLSGPNALLIEFLDLSEVSGLLLGQ